MQSLPPSERDLQRCEKVRSLHAKFHTTAADVLQLALAGRTEQAKAAIALGSIGQRGLSRWFPILRLELVCAFGCGYQRQELGKVGSG